MVTLSLGRKIYIFRPWGEPSGMWTQMVLNFHVFNFYTTQFSHITHATRKCLSHTRSGIPYTYSSMSNLRHPVAAPPVSHSLAPARSLLFLSKVLVCVCVVFFFIASYHHCLQSKQEAKTVFSHPERLLYFFGRLGLWLVLFLFYECDGLTYLLVHKSVLFFGFFSVSSAQSALAPSQSYVWLT